MEQKLVGYNLARILNLLSDQCSPNTAVETAIERFNTAGEFGKSPSELVLFILGHFDMLASDVVYSAIADDLREEYLIQIEQMKLGVQRAFLSRNSEELRNRLRAKEKATRLELYSDVVRTAGGKADYALDRLQISKDAHSLISDVVDSDLPEYAKKTLVLQLNALITALNHSVIYPDIEIRLRIKGIVADFMVDFEKMDDDYKSTREKILAFARKHLGIGAFALGLIADGTAVAALLPPP